MFAFHDKQICMSTLATMALTLAVDRVASIEVLKNIQSLAFSVQV